MVSVLYPGVQISHPVIRLVLEVELIRVVDQSCPEGKGESSLQVTDHGVDEGGWDGNAEPL